MRHNDLRSPYEVEFHDIDIRLVVIGCVVVALIVFFRVVLS